MKIDSCVRASNICTHDDRAINRNFRERPFLWHLTSITSVWMDRPSRLVASRRLASRRRRGRPRDERDWRDAIDVHAWHTLVARNSIALRCYASRRRQVRPWPADGRIDIRAKRQVVLHGMFARRPRFRRRDEYYDVEVTRRNNV